MKTFNVALLGFGNVNRALAELLMRKAKRLQDEFELDVRVVGIATGSRGNAINPNGLDLDAVLEAVHSEGRVDQFNTADNSSDTVEFLANCPAELVFEATPTNPEDGQPAFAYIFGALERGIHVVTANKGPVVFGYRELSDLAQRKGVGFFFESTVMDGAPVMSTAREAFPASNIHTIRGIFNSTTNYILSQMEEQGISFEEALKGAQEIGVAETDPTLDVDGWDSAIKTAILANVAMGSNLTPADVAPTGIRNIQLEDLQAAMQNGMRTRLLCEAVRNDDGSVNVSVSPRQVSIDDPLAKITGTSNIISFEADTLHHLTIIENNPGPDTTAYGMFVDMVNLVRGRHRLA